MLRTTLCTITMIGCVAFPASAFTAKNNVKVFPVAGGFEVYGGNGLWSRGAWCAASDYAIRTQNAGNFDRIYVKAAPAAGQANPTQKAVVFTMDPAGLEPTRVESIGPSIETPGANLAVHQAFAFCADSRLLRNG